MSIIIHCHLYLKEDADLMKNISTMIETTKKEDGCISYTFVQEPLDKTHYMMIEQWKSKQHLDAHSKSEHFKVFISYINTISTKPADIQSFEVK
ncbi:ABM domain-containing protein [Entamoeba marina]